jgi:HD-GYP domain-containing protein (c-di-GMP phosphodiesterase class II)
VPNRHYVEELQSSLTQTVAVIRALGELRDPYTAGHERRVGDLAAAIGAEMGFNARRQQGLRIAGYLHDIGKIAIPSEILSKPGRLTPAEFALVKEHPERGHEILSNVDFPWPVALVARQHHERMDGSGYPQGLAGDQITIKARIVAIADVVESMSAHRPYRPAHGIDVALAEIERGKGTAFDTEAADACLRLVRDKGYKIHD